MLCIILKCDLAAVFGHISLIISRIELKPGAFDGELNSTEDDCFIVHHVIGFGHANWVFLLSRFEQFRLSKMKIGHDVTKWSFLENQRSY